VTRPLLALKYLYLPLMSPLLIPSLILLPLLITSLILLPLLIPLLILPLVIPLPPLWLLQRSMRYLPSPLMTTTSPPMTRMRTTLHLLLLMGPTSSFTMASTSTCPSWRRRPSTVSLGAVISVSSQAGKLDMQHLLRLLNLNVRYATGPKVLGVSRAIFHKVDTVHVGVDIVKHAIDRGEAVQVL
jgi:hypothetical protein